MTRASKTNTLSPTEWLWRTYAEEHNLLGAFARGEELRPELIDVAVGRLASAYAKVTLRHPDYRAIMPPAEWLATQVERPGLVGQLARHEALEPRDYDYAVMAASYMYDLQVEFRRIYEESR